MKVRMTESTTGRLDGVVTVIEVCELFRFEVAQGTLTCPTVTWVLHIQHAQRASDHRREVIGTCDHRRIHGVGHAVASGVEEELMKAAVVNLGPQPAQCQ